ncbi:MAG TPA: hypothetical protein VMF69_10850 [Gemmataceae bacterium]|nr:hypothetical protein [Gemmataceae bacterium]
MSSSFTDQPSPHEPRHDAGFTPTPPPGPGREEDDVDAVRLSPKLGSLAQKARGKQLKQARVILFVVGVLLILVNAADIVVSQSLIQEETRKQLQQQGGIGQVGVNQAQLQQQVDVAFLLVCAIDGGFVLTGGLFILFGIIIYRFPVLVTILSLVLYVLTWLIAILLALAIDPIAAASVAGGGIVLRIIVIVVLAKSIQSAFAYERERRELAELEAV